MADNDAFGEAEEIALQAHAGKNPDGTQPCITDQPQPVGPAAPPVVEGVPPGLESLATIDRIQIQQQIELLEVATKWETKNKYKVLNCAGQQICFAEEESSACQRQCCGSRRGFQMHIADNKAKEVIRVNREFKCCARLSCCACFGCCAMEISVQAPIGQNVGFVKQECSLCAPTYGVYDADGKRVLGIRGPMCFCRCGCCPCDIEFKLTGEGGKEVGKISKEWAGIANEVATDADNFEISFPMDLDVRIKAVLLGAVFLIDFMYFENKPKKKD